MGEQEKSRSGAASRSKAWQEQIRNRTIGRLERARAGQGQAKADLGQKQDSSWARAETCSSLADTGAGQKQKS